MCPVGAVSRITRRARACVTIRDEARLFDPTAVRESDWDVSPLERDEAGGFGLALIRRLVDELRYRVTEDGGNELLLVKKRR